MEEMPSAPEPMEEMPERELERESERASEREPEPEQEMVLKREETSSRMSLPAELRAELGSVIVERPPKNTWVPLPDMYKDMINLIPMNFEEEQVLKKVLRKDDDYKKSVEERLSVLRREIRTLRDRWEADQDADKKKRKKPRIADKMCARCKQPQGILGTIKWWFVRKPRCQRCHFYVCKLCRHKQINGQWLCALCVRYREVQQLTGEWFARCRGIAGSDLVKASLRIMEQNPQWRDKPVAEVQQAPPPRATPPPAPPPQRKPSKKRKKHGKRKVSRKSTTRIRKKGSKASVRGSKSDRRSTLTAGELTKSDRRSTLTAGELTKRKSSMKADKKDSVPAMEPAQGEEITEAPPDKMEPEEGKTENKVAETPAPKRPRKKQGSTKAKGKKKGGKGKKKGKGKGNVNVSFATEGKDTWNNNYESYDYRNNGVTKSSEDSRMDAETTDSVSEFTENSEDSMPIGTSAAGEERKRRRKLAGRISTDSLEIIIAPTLVYFDQSNKQSKHNQENADMRQRGVVTKSSSDFKRWVANVNIKRHSFCKHNTAQPCEKLSPHLSHGSSSHQVHVREYSTSVEPKVRSDKDSHRRLQSSSTSQEPTLVSVQGQVGFLSSDKIVELTKPTRQHLNAFSSERSDRHKKETISTETNHISKDELLQLEERSDRLPHRAASTGSPTKEYTYSLEISKTENGVTKYNRKHAKTVEPRKAKNHAEAGEVGEIDGSIEKANKWLHYPGLSPMSKTISPTSKSHLSSKHRPGKMLSRPASNFESQPPVDSRREECSKATGNILFQNLSRSTVLRRLRCPVSYMFEYNESATAPAKPSDSQSVQDLNLNFPEKSKSSKKKKGKGKSGDGKKGKKEKKGKKKKSKSKKGSKGDKKKSKTGNKKKKSATDAAKGKEAADDGEKGASTAAKLSPGKKKKKSKRNSLTVPKMQASGLGLDLLMLGSSKTNLAAAPPPPSPPRQHPPSAAVRTECAQVQTEFKRRGTRCVVCPFCRLFCEYGKENLPY